MPATKVLIIYSVDQKVRRTTVVLDHEGADDSEFARWEATMQPGEAAVYVPVEVYYAAGNAVNDIGEALDKWLASQIGVAGDDACAVVRGSGEVLALVRADPRIDDHPDGFLIQDVEAKAGDSFDFETGELSSRPEDVDLAADFSQ